MKYISEDLTHFVGRSLADDDARYRLLLKIIGDGYLTNRPDFRAKGMTLVAGRGDPTAGLSSNEKVLFDMVCFCDIPVEAMSVHMVKYGRFGLAFRKEFVANQGGAPVRYIPRQTLGRWRPDPITRGLFDQLAATAHLEDPDEASRQFTSIGEVLRDGRVTLADAFDVNIEEYNALYGIDLIHERMRAERKSRGEPGVPAEFWRHFTLYNFIELQLFGFLKFYDLGLPDDHPDNYYMEREWRIVGELDFIPDDVSLVVIPGSYADQLAHDRPDVAGRAFHA